MISPNLNTTTGNVPLDRPEGRKEAEKVLTGPPMTRGYRPSIPAAFYALARGQMMPTMLADVEQMLLHPVVVTPYNYYKCAISTVTFHVRAKKKAVAKFVLRELQKFWQRCLDDVQGAYDYGWIGGELSYEYGSDGLLGLRGLETFHPLDCWALVNKDQYRGVSVLGAGKKAGRVALWGPTRGWPAKGFWFAHNRRWDRYYGRSQLCGAWRPWRRLGFRDGAEEVIDGGIYRFAYRGPIFYYPPKSFKKADGTEDFNLAQTQSREFIENAKAGVGIAIPNTRDERGNRLWELDWPDSTISVEGLMSYAQHLEQQISLGIGVPPELIQASDTGSGWSGRKVPMMGFFHSQNKNARAILWAWQQQIGNSLVAWNFGPDALFDASVELKMPTALSGDQQPGGGAPPGMGGPPPAGGGGGEEGGDSDNPLAGLMGG